MTDTQREQLVNFFWENAERTNSMSPAQALEVLVRDGVYTEQGVLTPEFGGKPDIDA